MQAALVKNGPMAFDAPPRSATWLHQEARTGFEIVYFTPVHGGHRIDGWTTADEAGQSWLVAYEIEVDDKWVTRRASVSNRTVDGTRTRVLDADVPGRWRVDGIPAPHLNGCLDVDLESSAMTNAFPAHRMALDVGEYSPAPAAYVWAQDLSVDRLEQTYERLPDEDGRQKYDYESPAFDFTCQLTYDESGLVVDYPGIAVRTS